MACRVVARSIAERFKRQPVFAYAPTRQSSLYAYAPSEDWRRGDSGLRPRTQICRANFHRGAAPLASLACTRSCHPDDLGKFFSQTLLGFESPPPGEQTKMEAGGFEPPSRDVSRQASTCLVVLLFFRLAKRQTTGSWLSYFGRSYRSRPEQPARPACFVTPLPDPQAKSGRTGRQIRQPCATDSCRLKFVAG